jgi:hypothetical protein
VGTAQHRMRSNPHPRPHQRPPFRRNCYDWAIAPTLECVDINGSPASPTSRFRGLFGARRKRNEELRFASRVCSESLAALAEVRAARPQLSGDELYEAVVARRTKRGDAAARSILQRTYESLEDWGNDRAPKLLDVVRYMIVNEYLDAVTGERGMHLDLGAFLAQHIDPEI